jgi:hypothetical protein
MLALIGLGTLLTVPAAPVGAINVFQDCSGANADTAVCKSKSDSASSIVQDIINLLLLLIGIIAVVMIIIGGIKYTTSNGDANQVTSAKNTVMYSVIGLIVALLASLIVNTVVKQFI